MQPQAKAIILARVSSKAQEDEGYSLDSQLKLMRNYCKSKKLSIVKEFKVAETASKEQRRKVFHELVIFITKHKVHHLIVEKTDRLTRNFKDATAIDDWLEKDEHRMLHVVKENLLLHKNARSDAKFMWNIYLSVAKKYTDNLREEAMKGWAEKLAQGWLPAPPPPGYMTITQDGKRIHVPNPETYKQIRRVFKLYLLPDYTLIRLSEEMAAMGLVSRRGRPFAKSYVSEGVLRNPFYIGVNRMDGKEYPGAQEPIVTKALFKAVQEKFQSMPHRTWKTRHNPIFKGMIICSVCGATVTWSKQKGRFYGSCRKTREECRGKKHLREDRVESIVLQKLEEIRDPSGKVFDRLKSALQIAEPQDVSIYRYKMIDDLSRQIKRLRRMEELLYEDKLAGVITKEKYESKRRQFAEQAAEAAERLTMLREAQEITKSEEPETESDNPIINLYLQGPPSQKRIIMANLFKRITANGDKVNIENTQ
jgi:DNA invertase Pin-like site-specific DNA recombinase